MDSKQKRKTAMKAVDENGVLRFNDDASNCFVFDVNSELSGELRVQLFKKSESTIINSKTVVANAGIYVKNIVTHILAHGQIDKVFKLFTKDGAAAGGEVQMRVNFEMNDTGYGQTGSGQRTAPDVSTTEGTGRSTNATGATETTGILDENGTKDHGCKPVANEKYAPALPPAVTAVACVVVAVAAFTLSTVARSGQKKTKRK